MAWVPHALPIFLEARIRAPSDPLRYLHGTETRRHISLNSIYVNRIGHVFTLCLLLSALSSLWLFFLVGLPGLSRRYRPWASFCHFVHRNVHLAAQCWVEMSLADKLVLAPHGRVEIFFLCLALPWERLLQRSGLLVAGTSKPSFQGLYVTSVN